MKTAPYLLALITVCSVVKADDFHPRQCASIGDVDVSHSIETIQDEYVLTNKDNTIRIRPDLYLVNDQQVEVGDTQLYYDLFTDFLAQSKEYSKQWANKGQSAKGGSANYTKTHDRQQSIAMCRTLLDLASVNAMAHDNDVAFVEAVNISLK